MFKVSDQNNLALCQLYCGYTSMSCQLDVLLLNFLDDVRTSSVILPAMLFSWFGRQEYQEIMNKYNMDINSGRVERKVAIKRWFSNNVIYVFS